MNKKEKNILRKFNSLVDFLHKNDNELIFNIEISKEGWIATCMQDNSIITGTTGSKPNQKEVSEYIADVLLSSFGLSNKYIQIIVKQMRKNIKKSPYQKYFKVTQKICE